MFAIKLDKKNGETYPQLEYYSRGLDDGTYSSAMEALNKIEKIIKEGDKDE